MSSLKEHLLHIKENGYHVASISQVSNDKGSVEISICDVCHYIEAVCNHELNTWNKEGTQLVCDLCGDEGT